MMKPIFTSLLLGMIVFPASFIVAADAFPPPTIPNSQIRVLPRNSAGRQYELYVSIPASYYRETARRYPVVFVTDAYWDFVKIDAIRGALNYDKVAPEYVTVGLGYAGENLDYGDLRRWELSPAPLGGGGADASGHASDFLHTIETEIIPFIEREYRIDSSHRVLAGGSLGGLFALYTMYTKPDLFSAYIAASPSVEVDNDWLFGYEDAFAKSGRTLHARLFVAVGGNESSRQLAPVKRFSERVVARKSPGLAYSFRIIEGERHAGMQFEAYAQGLIWAFAPIAQESGQSK